MDTKPYLITGGTGKLGKELQKHLPGVYVGIENYDFIYQVPKGEYSMVIHLGAYTNTTLAEDEPEKCFTTNAFGTYKLTQVYSDIPFVYISTEYANNPLGVYAVSKFLGEEVVKLHPQHLILRTSFKPTPWQYPFAYEDQYTQGDYVDVIAKLIADRITAWDKVSVPVEYIGTGRKTLLELARRTRDGVVGNRVDDYNKRFTKPIIPHDYE